MKDEIQDLNDKLYDAEKSIKQLNKRLDDMESTMKGTAIRTVSKSGYIKIPKRTAKDGDIVSIAKLNDEDLFKGE